MSDPGTWAGVGVSFAVGVAGLIFGVLGNKRAKQAVKEAGTANKLAAESNLTAVKANKIAEQANALFEAANARENERNDVRWDGRWKEPGLYRFTNISNDEAFRVRVEVVVDRLRAETTSERVGPGSWIDLELPEIAKEYAREQTIKATTSDPKDARLTQRMNDPLQFLHTIEEFVSWETQLGKPKTHHAENANATLDID